MAEVHDLIYHGRGGFPYDTVYNMPVIYRRYHIQRINEYLEKNVRKVCHDNFKLKVRSEGKNSVSKAK